MGGGALSKRKLLPAFVSSFTVCWRVGQDRQLNQAWRALLGQFAGERDIFARNQARTHLTKEHVLTLFAGFEIESFAERVVPSSTQGVWHRFHVVARKPAP